MPTMRNPAASEADEGGAVRPGALLRAVSPEGDARIERLREIQEAGIDLSAPVEGRSALSWALGWGRLEAARSLARLGAKILPEEEASLVALAALSGDEALDLVAGLGCRLDAKGGAAGCAALFGMASRDDKAEALARLLARGADPNARNELGATPLHWAARGDNPEGVKALLAAGADIEARDGAGGTPLREAALRGKPAALDALLAAGADMGSRDVAGRTALDCADEWSEEACARRLRAEAAEREAAEIARETPSGAPSRRGPQL